LVARITRVRRRVAWLPQTHLEEQLRHGNALGDAAAPIESALWCVRPRKGASHLREQISVQNALGDALGGRGLLRRTDGAIEEVRLVRTLRPRAVVDEPGKVNAAMVELFGQLSHRTCRDAPRLDHCPTATSRAASPCAIRIELGGWWKLVLVPVAQHPVVANRLVERSTGFLVFGSVAKNQP